ncbi:LRR receptor kinase SERK2-like [Humulus lupulus]|uniref:LRR receptor kinase SERK2-like n=1 Tax=Humulus lupulus TaxID=3486 RepID=UPI002B411591|nr:LRR receptor kinase SERK2-like [Humulus lupulus]
MVPIYHAKTGAFESNSFSGTIPSELGKLVNLVYLNLNSNNLTGEFPLDLTNPTKLTELRISSNYFTGRMPEFGNCKQLQILYLTSNLFSGPIPEWIKLRDGHYQIDLSYNNFSETSEPSTCRETFNLFRSSSGQKNNS